MRSGRSDAIIYRALLGYRVGFRSKTIIPQSMEHFSRLHPPHQVITFGGFGLRKEITALISESSTSQDMLSALRSFACGNSALESLEENLVEFDAFSFLGIATVEDFHSKMLAWLLDPQGSHAAGDYFLKRFLLETGSVTKEELDEAE